MRIFGLIISGVANIVATVVNVVVWLALLVTSFSGYVNPEHIGWLGLLAMILPITVALVALTMLVDAIFFKWLAVPTGIIMALCMPAMVETYPLNFPGPNVNPDKSWTLLTYNIHVWRDMSGRYAGDRNPTAEYIMAQDADVICLQEAERFDTIKRYHITGETLARFHKQYPTIIQYGHSILMSKFPATLIPVESISKGNGRGDVTGYRVNVHGTDIDIFSVHLRSHYLSPENKALYHTITSLNADSTAMMAVQNLVVNKLSDGNMVRAEQSRELARFITDNAVDNVIVCGDFNDVPTSYPLKRLERIGLHQVWPAVGLGYQWTFNRDRFLFRIDHILWRGDFKPISVVKGRVRSSDHYPLKATFILRDNSKDKK